MCSAERTEFTAGQEAVKEDPGRARGGRRSPEMDEDPDFLQGKMVWIPETPGGVTDSKGFSAEFSSRAFRGWCVTVEKKTWQ